MYVYSVYMLYIIYTHIELTPGSCETFLPKGFQPFRVKQDAQIHPVVTQQRLLKTPIKENACFTYHTCDNIYIYICRIRIFIVCYMICLYREDLWSLFSFHKGK